MQGWARLDAPQRQRFAEAFLRAALRLDRLELRAWLLRRLRNAPLAEPVDPARFAISDDMAALLKAMPLQGGRRRSRDRALMRFHGFSRSK
jgi:hypothetical protein